MKNDWELYIKDENKSEWRKVKHTNLNVNRRWGLEASKISCRVKNIAGYSYDWVKDSMEAKLYKNGKFYLYLHITQIVPSRTTKDSYLTIKFEDYWYFRLRKQLTCSELYGNLHAIKPDQLIKQALGTLLIIEDRFDTSSKTTLSATVDMTAILNEQNIVEIPTVGGKAVKVQDASVYTVGAAITLSPNIKMLEETKLITSLDTINEFVFMDTVIRNIHRIGNKIGCKATVNVVPIIKEEGERPDGFLELMKGLDNEYVAFGRVQSREWREDEGSWQKCQQINSVKLIKDDNVPDGGSITYYFSRDGGTTWYNITSWTDTFHTLTGSESVKNKPKWRVELTRSTKARNFVIDEDFSSSAQWTKTGTKFTITGGKLEADDYDTIAKHSLRYNTDLSTELDFFKDNWYMDFTIKKNTSAPPAEKRRGAIHFTFANQQIQAGESGTVPRFKIDISFQHDMIEPPEGVRMNLYCTSRYSGESVFSQRATWHSETLKNFGNADVFCSMVKEGGSLKFFVYADSARTRLRAELGISLMSMYRENLEDGSWLTPDNLKWLTISNMYAGYDVYGYNADYTVDDLKFWRHGKQLTSYYSPAIDEIKILCKTNSESGVEEGTIEGYTAPSGMSNMLDMKFSRENRLKMLQQILSASPTDTTSNNPSPVWDCWIETLEDKTAKLHFKEFHNVDANYEITRKGESVGDNYIKEIKKEIDFTNKINSIHLIGGGWSVGLSSVLLHVNNATDEVKNKTAVEYAAKIISRRIRSDRHLEAISYTLLELLKNSKDTYTIVPYPEWRDKFNIGEFVTVKDLETQTDELLRIREENWSVGNNKETLNLVLESGAMKIQKYLTEFISNQRANSTITQGVVTSPPVSYNDNFDVKNPPEMWFYIPKNKKITKVSLFLKNQRFRAYSKASKEESTHTHGQPTHTHTQPTHTHVIGGKAVTATEIDTGEHTDAKPEDGTSQLLTGVTGNSGNLLADSTWRTIRPLQYTGVDTDVEEILHHLDLRFDFTNVVGNISVWSIRIRHVSTGTIYYPDTSGLGLVKAQASNIEQRQSIFRQLGKQKQYEYWYLEALVGGNGTYRVDYYWDVKEVDTRHTHGIAGKVVKATIITTGETSAAGGDDTTASGGDDTTEAGSSHTHDLDFGIYVYPYFCPQIQMYVDNNGLPSPIFGRRGTEDRGFETFGIDITPDFDSDGDGIIDVGWHVIKFIPDLNDAINNTEGLGRMMVYLGFEEVST